MITKLMFLSYYGIKECSDCKHRFDCFITIHFKSLIPHGNSPDRKREIIVWSRRLSELVVYDEIVESTEILWCGTIRMFKDIPSIEGDIEINKTAILERLRYDKRTGDINVHAIGT